MDEVTLAICRATDNVREGSGCRAEPVRLVVHYRSTARRAGEALGVQVLPRYFRNLEVRHLGGGSHFVQADQPEAIGDAIREWRRLMLSFPLG
jgi:hypothetical protein